MAKYNFKDKYLYKDALGIVVEDTYLTTFHCYLGTANGNGTRNLPSAPFFSAVLSDGGVLNRAGIFTSGRYKISASFRTSGGNSAGGPEINGLLLGQGIGKTIFADSQVEARDTNRNRCNIYFKDVTLDNLRIYSETVYATKGFFIINKCELLNIPQFTGSNEATTTSFSNNIFHFIPSSPMVNVSGRNTIIGGTGTMLTLTAQLYHKCNIKLTTSDITSKASLYTAFNDCAFMIGEETGYMPLAGNSPEELRADFVARCEAQNITLANITEGGEALPQGRWVFTKKSVFENIPYKNSDIHQFEKKRNIVLGLLTDRFEPIAISADNNAPNTFISDYASDRLIFRDNSLIFDESVDITEKYSFEATSKVIWLGGRREMQKMYVPNTLLRQYGVLIDSTPNLNQKGIYEDQPEIEEGELYFVRSVYNTEARILYNGEVYDTDMSSTIAHFRGVAGVKHFSAVGGDPVVYKLDDLLQYYTIQMRIVNEIPNKHIIPNDPLSEGCWYLVEHKSDQYNDTDYITYKGVKYKSRDSFLAKGNLTFTTSSPDVHLRKCWEDDFYVDSSSDEVFWRYKQKPKWFDVVPDDLRCVKRNNNILSEEMQTDNDGNYITSGHPDFYHLIQNILPSFYIRGTYVQFRLNISTQNLINII